MENAENESTEELVAMSLDMIINARKNNIFNELKPGNRKLPHVSHGRHLIRKNRQERPAAPYKLSNKSWPILRKSIDATLNTYVIVENLPYDTTMTQLLEVMEQAGRVKRAEIPVSESGHLKGFGVVEYVNAGDAREAISLLQGIIMSDRYLKLTMQTSTLGLQSITEGQNGLVNSSNSVPCSVYVGNLSWQSEEKDIESHMRQAGRVKRIQVFVDNLGRSKGSALVEFFQPHEAQAAISILNNTELQGRIIYVREYRESESLGARNDNRTSMTTSVMNNTSSSGSSVYVGNLSWNVSRQDLMKCMRIAGDVKHVEILTTKAGLSKGCAVVTYANAVGAQNAIRCLTDTELNGRLIYVREDRCASEEGAAESNLETKQVTVLNLDKTATWQDLKNHFQVAGHVIYVEIAEDKLGRSKGQAIVRFANQQSVNKAVRMLNRSMVGQHCITVLNTSAYIDEI